MTEKLYNIWPRATRGDRTRFIYTRQTKEQMLEATGFFEDDYDEAPRWEANGMTLVVTEHFIIAEDEESEGDGLVDEGARL